MAWKYYAYKRNGTLINSFNTRDKAENVARSWGGYVKAIPQRIHKQRGKVMRGIRRGY